MSGYFSVSVAASRGGLLLVLLGSLLRSFRLLGLLVLVRLLVLGVVVVRRLAGAKVVGEEIGQIARQVVCESLLQKNACLKIIF